MKILLLTAAFAALSFSAAQAADYVVTIKDHKFDPAELTIPANEKAAITVKNLDATPEEFESHELKREKVIKGNSEAIIKLGPLKPGTYKYIGEFNQDTAQGTIVVK